MLLLIRTMSKLKNYDSGLYKSSKLFSIIGILFSCAFGGFILANQAWGLQTREVLNTQWAALAVTTAVFALLAILSFKPKQSYTYYVSILLLQSLAYIFFISLIIYYQRGMASNAIVLYSLPIIAMMLSRTAVAIFAVSIASITGYTLAILKYFQDFPSEGYKIELYGQMLFYGFILLLIAYSAKIALDYLDSSQH